MTKHVIDQGNGALLLKNCIISYPTLFQPRRVGKPGQQTGEPKFSADFILPADLDDDDKALLAAAYQKAIKDKFGDNPPELRTPWKDATKADPSFSGRLRLAAGASQDKPPGVYTLHGR